MTTAQTEPDTSLTPGRRGSGFWLVVFAFLVVMSFSTLPGPLYGIYRLRDNLGAFTITVVYAIFAAGTIATLLADRYLAERLGRRGVMLAAVATMMVAAALLASWKALPGLLIGRLLTGVAVGLAAGTALTYLIELRLRADPGASIVRARIIGTSVNVGALGVGPLLAGALAQWVRSPLTVPYLVVIGLGLIALIGLSFAPETGQRAPGTIGGTGQIRRKTASRLPVPAAAGTLAAFGANGLFAGLSGLFLSTTFGHPAHVLSGATLFLVFSCGVLSQLATNPLPPSRVLAVGSLSMLVGLVLLVVSIRLSTPNLAIFLISGGLIGAGSGAVFKGTTGMVLASSAPEDRVAMTADLLIALFLGLSVPVIGAGIALKAGASSANTVLVFAIIVGLGVSASGFALLRRTS
jgi:MFS family permease